MKKIPNDATNGYLDLENRPFNTTGLYSMINSNIQDSKIRYSQLPETFEKFKSDYISNGTFYRYKRKHF